jgi:hypothetical protein
VCELGHCERAIEIVGVNRVDEVCCVTDSLHRPRDARRSGLGDSVEGAGLETVPKGAADLVLYRRDGQAVRCGVAVERREEGVETAVGEWVLSIENE